MAPSSTDSSQTPESSAPASLDKDQRIQPWKSFWPPKLEHLSEEQLKAQPWLTWGPEPEKPDGKPWYDWMRQDQSVNQFGVVCRRGAN
jgi:hypothetical protein